MGVSNPGGRQTDVCWAEEPRDLRVCVSLCPESMLRVHSKLAWSSLLCRSHTSESTRHTKFKTCHF